MIGDPNLLCGGVAPRVNEIRDGLAASEFEPFFQPIISLTHGRLVGFEALARWRHHERGLLAPVDFVATAEQHGLIREIDAVILERAWDIFERFLEVRRLMT